MRFMKDNGLTLALMLLFFGSLVGMLLTGWQVENEELVRHSQGPVSMVTYFFSHAFQSALFENWESEFLQMSAYVMMTAILFQRGSSESKDPDEENAAEDEDPAKKKNDPDAPWPVRAGAFWRQLYSYSLGTALALLFLGSFILHWLHSVGVANEQALQHGEHALGAWEYLGNPQLWFESFQNWQSEFLSTAVLVVLSIVLRFRGSPESKPVAAPHATTGH
jgi:fucose permease